MRNLKVIRNAQWCAGCYRDIFRTKHFKMRRWLGHPGFYISGAPRYGFTFGVWLWDFSVFWGFINAIIWEDIQKERQR
jgi:hypothetical protein